MIVGELCVARLSSSATHAVPHDLKDCVLFPCLPLAVSVLDPVFLARRRVSQASQQSMEIDHARDKEAGHVR